MWRRAAIISHNRSDLFGDGHRSWRQVAGMKRHRAEWPGRSAVDHQFEIDRVVRQVEDVFGLELRRELAPDYLGVLCAKSERDHRADVAQDCVSDIRLKLVQVLMREHESHPVLAKFGHHIRDCECGEILEFVEVCEEIVSITVR